MLELGTTSIVSFPFSLKACKFWIINKMKIRRRNNNVEFLEFRDLDQNTFHFLFSRDSDLTSSPRDEDMLEKDVDMYKHIHIFFQHIHISKDVDMLKRDVDMLNLV